MPEDEEILEDESSEDEEVLEDEKRESESEPEEEKKRRMDSLKSFFPKLVQEYKKLVRLRRKLPLGWVKFLFGGSRRRKSSLFLKDCKN